MIVPVDTGDALREGVGVLVPTGVPAAVRDEEVEGVPVGDTVGVPVAL